MQIFILAIRYGVQVVTDIGGKLSQYPWSAVSHVHVYIFGS